MPAFILDDEIFLRFAAGKLSRRENLKVAWHLAHSEEARRRFSELVPEGEAILAGLGLTPASGVQKRAVTRRRPKPRYFEDEEEEEVSPLAKFVAGELSHRENVKFAWRLMTTPSLREELARLPGGRKVLEELLGGLLPDWQIKDD